MRDVQKRTKHRGAIAGAFVAAGILAGCANLKEIRLPGIPTAAELNAENELEETYRHEYQVNRSPEAIRWLKARRIKSGMNVGQINTVFGEDGKREYEDTRFKTGGDYLASDETYRWGPDAAGNSHPLVFRSGRLVNFDPREYE